MKTIEITVYSFDELSDEAKQRAINDNSEINVDYDWWDTTYEDAKRIGLKLTGFGLDRNKHANGEFIKDATYCANEIIKEHGESCDTYKLAKSFLENSLRIANEVGENFEEENYEEFTDSETQFLNDLLDEYANMLQSECEYLQTDEAIVETLIANDYEFLKNGKKY